MPEAAQHAPRAPVVFVSSEGGQARAAWLAELQRALPEERIVAFGEARDADRQAADIAIVANPDPAELAQLPGLRWVHSVWAGVERLVGVLDGPGDAGGRARPPFDIVRLVDPQLAATMSEAVLAWTLYLHRAMPAYAQQQREARWQPLAYVRPGRRSIGMLGLGQLGAASARRLAANGFTVRGWSRSRSAKSLPGIECYSGADGLDALLARSDIVVCLLPLTPDTRALLDARRLARLPRGASLINFARGAIVDDEALHALLDEGHIDHAVLDVFASEPLTAASWHWRHARVTVLPHCSAPTDRESAAGIVAANVRRYRQSGELPACVDRARGY